ncbi:hypothetical protein HY251_01960, partial [bacterium]|nr:hypothetical protein [bacterium]
DGVNAGSADVYRGAYLGAAGLYDRNGELIATLEQAEHLGGLGSAPIGEASAPASPPPSVQPASVAASVKPEYRLTREPNDTWRIRIGETEHVGLRGKGWHDLAAVLTAESDGVTALDLESAKRRREGVRNRGASEDEAGSLSSPAAGEDVLDLRALRECGERIRDLAARDSRTETEQGELEQLRGHVLDATAPHSKDGGRRRRKRLGDEAERARKSVARRIDLALRRLPERSPIRQYLMEHVQLGFTLRHTGTARWTVTR